MSISANVICHLKLVTVICVTKPLLTSHVSVSGVYTPSHYVGIHPTFGEAGRWTTISSRGMS
jgi:hypothetical protein